jgi:hypothetical protein
MAEAQTRDLVKSFQEGSAVCEVWESRSPDGVKVYFDIRCNREFASGGERKRGPFIQQRDMRDLIIAIVRAEQYISDRHAEIRRSRWSEEDDRGPVGDGAFELSDKID